MNDTLIIKNIDFDLLEKQRVEIRKIHDYIHKYGGIGVSSDWVDSLEGVCEMLDSWSDNTHAISKMTTNRNSNMRCFTVESEITLSLSADFEVPNSATEDEIKSAAQKALNREANDLLGGIDFLDSDLKVISIREDD